MPLYHQIFVQLRNEILSGERPLGALVPTEFELAETFGVSRITARRAVDELAAQDLVVRKRRVGTTVIHRSSVDANVERAVNSLVTFGRKTKVTVLEFGEEAAQEPTAGLIGLPVGSPVIRAVRLRWLDGEPLGYIVSHVPKSLESVVTRAALKASPILSLLTEAGCSLTAAVQSIAAVPADPAMARVLAMEPMMPLLRVTRAFRDAHDEPILLTRAYYRADRYQIRLNLNSAALEIDTGLTSD